MATEEIPLGFDGIGKDNDRASPTDYTVQFTPASDADTPHSEKTDKSEEIGLLERGGQKKALSAADRVHRK